MKNIKERLCFKEWFEYAQGDSYAPVTNTPKPWTWFGSTEKRVLISESSLLYMMIQFTFTDSELSNSVTKWELLNDGGLPRALQGKNGNQVFAESQSV